MTSEADMWLELGAKFTVLMSVIIIIYFCGFTAWRIARFQDHPWNFWGNVFTSRREIAHTPTLMPFTLSLKEDTVNESDQVTFHLTCKVRPGPVKVLWAVDAGYLFKTINAPSWEMVKELKPLKDEEDQTQRNFSWHSVEELSIRTETDGSYEGDLTIATPAGLDWRSLMNQYKYPLAVFVLVADNSITFSDPSTIIGICAIVHVKNSTVPKSSTIHAQYIKLQGGQAHLLQSLFVMDSGPQDEPESDAAVSGTVSNQPFADVCCSVCQVLPVSRAIIPCRHVCLCARCFTKVDSCPICRGFISCYFRTRDESYMDDITDEDESDLFS